MAFSFQGSKFSWKKEEDYDILNTKIGCEQTECPTMILVSLNCFLLRKMAYSRGLFRGRNNNGYADELVIPSLV